MSDFMKRAVVTRGLGGVSIAAVQQDAVTVSPAVAQAANGAVDQIVTRSRIFKSPGPWAMALDQAHAAATPAIVTTPTQPAPGAVNANNTANHVRMGGNAGGSVSTKGLTGGGLAEQIRRLPPIVGEPLRWAPAIGLGLYLLGHEKAGVVVMALGFGRYFIVQKRR